MEAYPDGRAGHPGEGGGGADEELHIDEGIDLHAADLPEAAEAGGDHLPGRAGANGEDVVVGDEIEEVENEAVFLKEEKVDVLGADLGDSAADGLVGEDGGALL